MSTAPHDEITKDLYPNPGHFPGIRWHCIYTDQTGRFLVHSSRGSNYIVFTTPTIATAPSSLPVKNGKKDPGTVKAYKRAHGIDSRHTAQRRFRLVLHLHANSPTQYPRLRPRNLGCTRYLGNRHHRRLVPRPYFDIAEHYRNYKVWI
jgi:hypothetical protein